MKKLYLFKILFLFALGLSAQSIIYVDQNVQGGGQDGSSWANATPDLSLALDLAVAGDLIWVAAGTYLPTTTTDRGVSFNLKQGVRLYGGFTGDETGLLQRDYVNNETILSGNIGDPASVGDNVFHVLRGIGLDSTTVLDGFTITQGYAYNVQPAPFTEARGGGLLLEPSPLVPNTCPIIQNCRFQYNQAGSGGALHCKWDFTNLVNPILRNCQFIGNRAFTLAGAIYKDGPADATRPFTVENCTFFRNRALGGDGGAIFMTSVRNVNVFVNCRFEQDTAVLSGGAIYCAPAGTGEVANLTLDSCVFEKNYANEGAGFYYADLIGYEVDLQCVMKNCVFRENKTDGGTGPAFFFFGFAPNKMGLVFEGVSVISNWSVADGIAQIQSDNVDASFSNCKFMYSRNPLIPTGGDRQALKIVLNKGQININNSLFANNGAGVFIYSPDDGQVISRINNCTFFNNGNEPFNKRWYDSFAATDSFYNECYINNCVFWESYSSNIFWNGDPFVVSGYGYHIDHTALSLIPTDTLMPGGPAAFGDHNIFRYAPPLFVDTLADDYRLLPCSPGVDAGNNVIVDSLGLTTDLDGNLRIFGDTVDMGAYETQDSCAVSGEQEVVHSASAEAAVAPNPVGCSETVQVRGGRPPEATTGRWSVFDAGGRFVATGSGAFSDDGSLPITAPEKPGLYWVYVYDLSTPLKLVVLN